MNIQELLLQAQDLSQDLYRQLGPEVYQFKNFQGYEVPELNMEIFEARVIGRLKSLNKLPESTRLSVEPFELKTELLGIVFYMLRTDCIDVHIASHLSNCKKRLVVCKELCQIYLDKLEEKDAGLHHLVTFKDIYKQIFELVELHNETVVNFDKLNMLLDDQNRTEFLSFFMAVNLIFPPGHRDDFDRLYAMIGPEQGNVTLYDVAFAYQMPQFALKFFHKRMLPYYQESPRI